MLLMRILVLKLLLVQRAFSNASAPATGFLKDIPRKLGSSLTAGTLGHRNNNENVEHRPENYLTDQELEEIERHQRQIRFKDSYEDLPVGLPRQTSDDGNSHDHDHLSYFVQVDVEDEPLIDMNFRNLLQGAQTYFPPEVITLDLLYSSEDEGKDTYGFFKFQKEQESHEAARSENLNSVSSSRNELSPFYIPINGIRKSEFKPATTTEVPIFLTKESSIASQSISSNLQLDQSKEIEDIYITPHPPLSHFSNYGSKGSTITPFDKFSNEQTGSVSKSIFHKSYKNNLPTFTTHSYAQGPTASGPSVPKSDAPFFITNEVHTKDLISNHANETQVSSTDSVKMHNYVRVTAPPRTLSPPLKHGITTPPSNLSPSVNYEFPTPSRTLLPQRIPDSPTTRLQPPKLALPPINGAKRNSFRGIANASNRLSPPLKSSYTNAVPKSEIPSRGSKTLKSSRRKEPLNKDAKNLNKPNIHKSALAGIYGTQHSRFDTPPDTKFDCSLKSFGGYYADPETNCQVFHVCLGGRSAAFLCPTGTLFSQRLLVCDWWYNVDCSSNHRHDIHNQNTFVDPASTG